MNITHFKLDDGSPLTSTPDFKIVLEWLAPFISDFSEDEFWAWLDKFYENGPTEEQIQKLINEINPTNSDDLRLSSIYLN